MLAPGTRLGPYEVVAPLGAGGMGEVYRAKDTRLGREVALKVLAEHLSSQPEVRSRFEREAKTVSSLNHPNICTLFDVGREGETDFLVMELIEGETLAHRVTRGPLPLDEALRVGGQVADALDRAHRAGVIHRDLKPGNVMLTRSGAKLMDFGLARAAGLGGPGSGSFSARSLTHSPTIAAPLTAEGTIVGTFQYMAPEQLEGGDADARSDVWALGCVLYEMVTGRRAFDGRSQASLISAIMSSEPAPVSSITPASPPELDRLISRCLMKDPDERWQNARDLMHELRALGTGAGAASAAGARVSAAAARPRAAAPWPALLAALLVAFAAGALLAPRFLPARDTRPALSLAVPIPHDLSMAVDGGDLAVSPDGSAVAMVLDDTAGVRRLWLRTLEGGEIRPLVGTEDALMPFWSPDGRSIAFFTTRELRKIAIAGGTSQDIAPAAAARGGSWGRDDQILFAPGAEGPIYRVSANGGTPVPVTVVDTARKEIGHRFPRFLPDGRRFLFATTPLVEKEHEVFLAGPGKEKPRFVLRCDGTPSVSPEGWLLYRRNRMLHAQRFDAGSGRLSGEPKALFETGTFVGLLAVSTSWPAPGGLLFTLPELVGSGRLAWVTRDGRVDPLPGLSTGFWLGPAISPDGSRLACARGSSGARLASGYNLWIIDVARGLATQFTFESGAVFNPVWSPDGRQIAFSSNREGAYALYVKPVEGVAESRLVARSPGLTMTPTGWTRDGSAILCEIESPRTSNDVFLAPIDGTGTLTPLLQSEAYESGARISPDGRWIAYSSDESGRVEVYVDAFPGLGRKRQVSTAGGNDAYWRADGRELYFKGLDNSIMGAPVAAGAEPVTGVPVRLFRSGPQLEFWCPAPDGRRFLIVEPDVSRQRMSPRVTLNWTRLTERAK